MPDQPLCFTLHYEEAALRRAVAAFMRRRVLLPRGKWQLAALLLVSCLALGLGAGPAYGLGLAGGLAALAGLLVLIIWRAHLGNTLGRFRAMKPASARFVLNTEALTVSSGLGSGTIPWQRFTERWELDGVWMLFMEQNTFINLPTRNLPEEAREFIRRRVPAGRFDPLGGAM